MSILKINGAEAAVPSELRVELTDVGTDAQRSVSGRLVTDRVAVKRRLRLKWPLLTADELGALLKSIQPTFFEVVYPDPEVGARTMTCRCSERAMGVLRLSEGEAVWTNVEMVWEER